MAKSLVCNDCKALLRSVAEAQAHNEATGHSNFEETTVAVKLMVCTECSKACRTEAERDLHKRYTGHSKFTEKEDDGRTINTEQEMKEAQEMEVDEVPQPDKPNTSEAVELVPAQVDAALLASVCEMGFSEVRATRAIYYSNASDAEGAVNWLVEHDTDPDIDQPLLVPKAAAKKEKLSPAEAKKAAEELVRRAKERREREERESGLAREKDRIRVGKEIAAAKRAEEEGQLKRNAEARMREKEEEKRAREKLKKKLEEDRKERRRKLGLPEEMTEEEKAAEAERLEKERLEAEKRKAAFVTVKPVSVLDKLRATLVTMKKACEGRDEAFKTAVTTMMKYIGNIVGNPAEEKFRTIKLSNAAFSSRVGSISGAIEFFELCGFQRTEDVLTMPPNKVDKEVLNGAGVEMHNALSNPFFGVL